MCPEHTTAESEILPEGLSLGSTASGVSAIVEDVISDFPAAVVAILYPVGSGSFKAMEDDKSVISISEQDLSW